MEAWDEEQQRRRGARRREAARATPLARALLDPVTLLDRFILGLALGPPGGRMQLQRPGMRALTARLATRGKGETGPDG